jgi:hypothetical protein
MNQQANPSPGNLNRRSAEAQDQVPALDPDTLAATITEATALARPEPLHLPTTSFAIPWPSKLLQFLTTLVAV